MLIINKCLLYKMNCSKLSLICKNLVKAHVWLSVFKAKTKAVQFSMHNVQFRNSGTLFNYGKLSEVSFIFPV